MPKQVNVFYSGRVQGVGFRQTVKDIASRHPVQGWVRNRRDGRVELLAEGEETALHSFLAAIRTGPLGRNITNENTSWHEPQGLVGFIVRSTE